MKVKMKADSRMKAGIRRNALHYSLNLVTLLVIALFISLPVADALSINPASISAEVDKNEATINWQTDELASGVLKYGTSTENVFTIPQTGQYTLDHSIKLSDLQFGQKYYYTVESSDGVVTAKLTGWKDFSTLLGPVQNLVVKEVQPRTATLSWDKSSKEKSYNIYLAEVQDNQAGEFFLNATSIYKELELEGLEPETTYKAKVAATDDFQREGLFSNVVEFTTSAEPPSISFIQTLSITKSSATITWKTSIPSSGWITYDLDSTPDLIAEEELAAGSLGLEHSIKLDNLQPKTKYFYKIYAGKYDVSLSGNNGANDASEELGINSSLAESETKSFTTLENDPVMDVVDAAVSDIGPQKATISWKTTIEASCTLFYGIDDSFSSSKKDQAASTGHTSVLDDLLPGATYYYKIKCDTYEAPIASFLTLGGEAGGFLFVDSLPAYTTDPSINVTGKIKKGSRLYIFLNDDPTAKVFKISESSSFSEPILLNFAASQDGIPGKNIIKVLAWDPDLKKDMKAVSTIVDISMPSLQLDEFPQYVGEPSINVSGVGEPLANLEIFVNNASKKKTAIPPEGRFGEIIALGNDNQTLSVVLTDKAGNKAVVEKLIIVDRLAPKIDIFTKINSETHFKILTIEGKTEPNSKIYITNYGEFSGCGDIEWTRHYGECTSVVGKKYSVPGTMLSENVDILGTIIGNTLESTSDENGNFKVRVPLFMGTGLKMTGRNNVEFLVEDMAGNVGKRTENILYKPGCPDWQVDLGEIQSYPFNLYTKDFTDNSIEGSAFIPIEYVGSGTPTNIQVNVHKDINSIHESIFGNTGEVIEQEDATDLISLRVPKVSQLDQVTRKIYLYVPVTISRYSGSLSQLPDQLNVYLTATIRYRSDNAGYYSGTYTGSYFGQLSNYGYEQTGYGSCDVYPVLTYSIQKPIDYSVFLTPTMINNTIKFLDKTINVTRKISNYVQKAALFTLLGCGAMVAYNYLSAAFTTGSVPVPGQCSPAQQQMETTYWLCDRILCPNVPPRCEEQNWKASGYLDGDNVISDTEHSTRTQVNEDTNSAYQSYAAQYNLEHPDAPINTETIDPQKVNAWASKKKMTYYPELDSKPKIWTYTDPQTLETKTFEYIDVKDRMVTDKKAANAITREVEGQPLITIRLSESDMRASECDITDRTLVRVRSLSEETLSPFSGAKKVVTPDYFCMPTPAEQLDKPDPSFLGCYAETCPNFDHTKCLWTADINPPGGLWASTRCGCLPGIKSHLDNFIKIMEGAKKCLQQALIGEVRGGFCERLLAQFICDLFSELILKSFLGVGTDDYGILGGMGAKEGIQNYKSNSKQVSNMLSERYGGIVKNKMGLTGDQLVNKFCIAAITLDWSVLEGMLNEVVDSIPIEPIAYVEAESRAYGYDPFNGRMNIGYNIYVGLVPGGRTQTQMYLECDPSYANAMCVAGERKPIPRTFRQLDKNYPPIDENIVFVDQGALSWYNKVVFVLQYELGGDTKTEIIEKPITKKGDLAFGCTFSAMQGITCQTLALIDQQGGIAQVYPVGAGSYLSPRSSTFYPYNAVNLVLRVRNQFKDPYFFVRFNFDDSSISPLEYKIPGAGAEGVQYGADQFYDLWLGTVGANGMSLGAGQYRIDTLNFELAPSQDPTKNDNLHSNGELNIKLDGAEKAVLTIYPQIRTDASNVAELEPFTCEVWNSQSLASELYLKNPLYNKAVRQNGALVGYDNSGSISGNLAQELSAKDNDDLTYETFAPVEGKAAPSIPTIVQKLVGQESAKTQIAQNIAASSLDQPTKDSLTEVINEPQSYVNWKYDLTSMEWITSDFIGADADTALTSDQMAKFIELLGVKGTLGYYYDFLEEGNQIDNYRNWMLLKYQQSTGKKVSQVSQPISEQDFVQRFVQSDGLYTKCLVPQDRLVRKFGKISGTNSEILADQVISISRITANVIQLQEQTTNAPVLKIVSGSKEVQQPLLKGTNPVSSANTKTVGVTVSVLVDTNSNGQGDTPLLYEGRPQQFKFTYTINSVPQTQNMIPGIDILEPTQEFVNDYEELWVGANIQDEKNDLKSIKMRIVNSKTQETCETWLGIEAMNPAIDPEHNSCGVYEIQSLLGEQGKPSFVRFKMNLETPPASDIIKAGKLDYYTIHVEASDGDKIGKAYKGFRVVTKQTAYGSASQPLGITSQGIISGTTVGGNIVCLGGEACSQWVGPYTPTEVLLDPNIQNQNNNQNSNVITGQYSPTTATSAQQTQQTQYDNYGNPWNVNSATGAVNSGGSSGYYGSSYGTSGYNTGYNTGYDTGYGTSSYGYGASGYTGSYGSGYGSNYGNAGYS